MTPKYMDLVLVGILIIGTVDQIQDPPPKNRGRCQKKQALRSSCELLRTKDSKRFKKEQTETFRELWEPLGTFRNCMQATVTACTLL